MDGTPLTVQYHILFFFAMSFLGWLMEVICKLVEFGRLINRGFLIGPYCPIYGVGSVLIVHLLRRYTESPLVVFVLAMVISGTLEYVTSYAMEKLFHARWWDYSHRRLNLDGRICAGTLIPFGLMGLMLVYGVQPLLWSLFEKIPAPIVQALCAGLMILMAADIIVSTNTLGKIRMSADRIRGDDTETLTRAVREKMFGHILQRRALRAFPYVRIYNHTLHEQFKKQKWKQEAMQKQRRIREEFRRYERELRLKIKADKSAEHVKEKRKQHD